MKAELCLRDGPLLRRKSCTPRMIGPQASEGAARNESRQSARQAHKLCPISCKAVERSMRNRSSKPKSEARMSAENARSKGSRHMRSTMRQGRPTFSSRASPPRQDPVGVGGAGLPERHAGRLQPSSPRTCKVVNSIESREFLRIVNMLGRLTRPNTLSSWPRQSNVSTLPRRQSREHVHSRKQCRTVHSRGQVGCR